MKRQYSDSFLRKIGGAKSFVRHWVPSKGKARGMLCGINLDRFDVIKFYTKEFLIKADVEDKKTKRKL